VRHDIWLRTLNPDAQRLTPEALAPDAFFTSPRALLALDWLLMTRTEQNRIERRSSQRFSYQVPVLLRVPADGRSGTGCTQDLSSRGALVWTALQLKEGTPVEMVLVMPSKITLAEDMNVCCLGHVTRLECAESAKPAVAVRIERYDFLHTETSVLPHAVREEPVARP